MRRATQAGAVRWRGPRHSLVLEGLWIPGSPRTEGSKRAFMPKGGRFPIVRDQNSETLLAWRGYVRDAVLCEPHFLIPAGVGVGVTMLFHFPRPKKHYRTGSYEQVMRDDAPKVHAQDPDLDKLVRAVGDALSGIAWADDNQICELDGSGKVWMNRFSTNSSGLMLTIRRYE